MDPMLANYARRVRPWETLRQAVDALDRLDKLELPDEVDAAEIKQAAERLRAELGKRPETI